MISHNPPAVARPISHFHMPFFTKPRGVNVRNSTLIDVAGNFYHNRVSSTAEEKVLLTLKPAGRRNYEIPACMEGTRESILENINRWLSKFTIYYCQGLFTKSPVTADEETTNILWISGSPGAGKSAIASSLVSELTKQRRLGSFLFFKRGDATLGDPAVLWRTVAFDLARFDHGVKEHLVQSLARTEIRDEDIRLHFECLIEEPLKNNYKLSAALPVIVIDALDECGSDPSQAGPRRDLLWTISSWSRLPRSFKLIVTSRDEGVPKAFHDDQVCRHIVLETGDSISWETQEDIRIFFEKSLESI